MPTLNTPDDPRHAVNEARVPRWPDRLAWLIVIVNLALVGYYYGDLPAEIPLRWNLAGEITDFGPRATVWILPILNLILTYVLGLSRRTPLSMFNYPVEITEANAAAQHEIALGLLSAVRLVSALLLLAVTYFVVKSGLTGESRFNEPLFWALMTALFAVIGYYLWRAYQLR